MKIIFLDIDGVLNSRESIMRKHKESVDAKDTYIHRFTTNPDEMLIAKLNEIIAATDAKIVLSSTWRFDASPFMMERFLSLLGFRGDIIDSTPHFSGFDRGDEIISWLVKRKSFVGTEKPMSTDLYENIDSFVILDDDGDMGGVKDFLVKIDNDIGITAADKMLAIKILNETKNPYSA